MRSKMKSIIKYGIIVTALVMVFGSCKKEFFTDVNENPNSPSLVLPSAKLATVEAALAYSQGGEFSRYTSMLTQQTLGASRQSEAYYQYIFTSQDFDNGWGLMFTSVMSNCKDLINQSDANNYNVYGGIGRCLMGYSLQLMVDMFGDVPYSEAFSGIEDLQPKYDDDAALYATINQLADEAIAKLSASDPGVLVPSGDDYIYRGDAAQWIKFAHALKARIAIHQSKTDPSKAALAIAEIDQSFTGNSDNAVFQFGLNPTENHPWYQFNEQRTDISFAFSPLADSLIARMDPRYPFMIDSAGESETGFGLSNYYGGPNGFVELITYDELQFHRAEALLRSSGDISGAQSAFQNGIRASFVKLGADTSTGGTYINTYGVLSPDVNTALGQIATEEWFALYLNPEAWTTWRRIGSPALAPIRGGQVPRRLLYPQTEYSYNAANTPSATLFTPRIFWDTP